jgi:hypothetical protein
MGCGLWMWKPEFFHLNVLSYHLPREINKTSCVQHCGRLSHWGQENSYLSRMCLYSIHRMLTRLIGLLLNFKCKWCVCSDRGNSSSAFFVIVASVAAVHTMIFLVCVAFGFFSYICYVLRFFIGNSLSQHFIALNGAYYVDMKGAAFNVTHFESRKTYLLYTAINTTEHG